MKLALLQFDTLAGAREQNIRTAERLLCGVECDLALLPEMFATGYRIDAEAIAEPATDSKTLGWMQKVAAERDCAVVGTIAIEERGAYYNRMYICLPDGSHFHYDKRHLFTFAGEDGHFSAGKERIIVEWRGVKIAPMVCYDLRFPAWSYLAGEVDLLLYSAAWATSRIGAWDRLLPARAIENQAWVVGVNRIGCDPKGTPHAGHSAAYNHFGEMVASCGEEECCKVVEIAPEQIASYREKFRAWQDADKIEIK